MCSESCSLYGVKTSNTYDLSTIKMMYLKGLGLEIHP